MSFRRLREELLEKAIAIRPVMKGKDAKQVKIVRNHQNRVGEMLNESKTLKLDFRVLMDATLTVY